MKRRSFLHCSASAAALACIDAHLLLAQTNCAVAPGATSPRITALRLLTGASFSDMKKFYCDLIGLRLVSETETELTVAGGETPVTFVKTEDAETQPFYHFAFNIPENKILSAYAWQKAKTPIVMPRPGASNEWRTAGHPKEIYNFQHWNAHSIFFLDPAANLVEYIARHDLKNTAEGDFSEKDILYASEIGFIVDEPGKEAAHFEEHLKLKPYRGNSATFQPMGDEFGLLLLLQRGTVWSGHSKEGHKTDIFKTTATIRGTEKKEWELQGYPYRVVSTET